MFTILKFCPTILKMYIYNFEVVSNNFKTVYLQFESCVQTLKNCIFIILQFCPTPLTRYIYNLNVLFNNFEIAIISIFTNFKLLDKTLKL